MSWLPDNAWGKSKITLLSNLMTRFLVTWQAELRTPRIIDCALVGKDDKPSPSAFKEGSAPEDEEWAVVALPDRKRDRAEWDLGQDHLLGAPRFGVLPLHHCQGPVIYRQVGCLAVGECWPVAVDNQKPGTRNSAL